MRARVLYDRGLEFVPAMSRGISLAERATKATPSDSAAWEQLAWLELNAANTLKNLGQDVTGHLKAGLAAARRAQALDPDYPRPHVLETQLLILRAGLAQDLGEPAAEDAGRAVTQARRLAATDRLPVTGSLLAATALQSRARAKALSGEDPFPDWADGLALLRALRERVPEETDSATVALSLAGDWAFQAVIERRREKAMYEQTAEWGRAHVAANPVDAVGRAMLGHLLCAEAVLRRSAGEPSEPLRREGEEMISGLLSSGLGPIARRALAQVAVEWAWAGRRPEDAAAAETRARDVVRASPQDAEARAILASALLLRAELAPAADRPPLLAAARKEAEQAVAGGRKDPATLALRGRIEERIAPGGGERDLAAAREMNPRLHLLAGMP